MTEKKCSPLTAAIVGFILGSIAMKLMERFCPYCCCCGRGDTCCCGDGEGDGEGCCCHGDASEDQAPEAEAEPAV
jgi:hypothetical protein